MHPKLRATWPRHTAKRAACAADGPITTAKSWVQARFSPSADTLLRMVQENRELRTELVRRLGEWDEQLVQAGNSAINSRAIIVDSSDRGSDRPADGAGQADTLRVKGA